MSDINPAMAFVLYCIGILVMSIAIYVLIQAAHIPYQSVTDRRWKIMDDEEES